MRRTVTLAIGLLGAAWLASACSRTGLLGEDESPAASPPPTPLACAPRAAALRIAREPSNLYFVLDRSGSMSEGISGSAGSKWDAVRAAAVDVVRALGSQARVGAAVFPAASGVCAAGEEVFPAVRGDPPIPGIVDGPVTAAFARAIDVPTSGYTPTAATLQAIRRPLASLPGRTSVVLATDGGPNCSDAG